MEKEKDDRFKHISADPKFRRLPQKERKVKIDKRFQSMFNDSKFKVKSLVDKRGRPSTFASTENYKKYYELSSSEDEEDDDETAKEEVKKAPKSQKTLKDGKKAKPTTEDSEESSEDKEEEENDEDQGEKALDIDKKEKKAVTGAVRAKLKDLSVDYARGGGQILSDSSSSEEESSDGEEGSEGEIEHAWGELDNDADRTDDSTKRLAVCNMDWNRVRSEDLMVLLNSFLPAGGFIKKIAVYQSEFGKKCMKEEEITGPKELAEQTADETGEDGFDVEKLRVYEMRRLKYYYAVVECDNIATASKIYEECDGIEFESSASKVDLRFIPDDTTFDETPRDECDVMPEAGKYIPQHFATSALTQSNFEMTWDETDPRRTGINKRLWASKDKDLDAKVLQDYLASSSGEESDDGEKKGVDIYRALLQGDDKDDTNKEMEITWGFDLQNKVDEKTNEKLRKEAGLGELTPFQQMLQKKKDKRRLKQMAKMSKKENSGDEDEGDEQDLFSDDELPEDAEDIKQQLMMEREPKGKKGKKKNKKGKKNFDEDESMDEKEKAELELLTMDEDNEKHFNFNSRVPKKNQTDDDFQVDVKDPRFSALYSSHHYNLDPSDSHFKSTKGTQAFVAEKLRIRSTSGQVPVEPEVKKDKKSSASSELSRLVKSVKRKAEENNQRKVKSKKRS